jgi:glyoxylase-like metal-dependent hydrolase (beta-lactamase superfamily II)
MKLQTGTWDSHRRPRSVLCASSVVLYGSAPVLLAPFPKLPSAMLFRQIFDDKLAQYAYLIGCQATGEAVLIDPERDIDQYLDLAEEEGVEIVAVTETHIHADFLSGAREFAERFDTKLYLSDEGTDDWKYEWAQAPKVSGGSYDVEWLYDGDTFSIGHVDLTALHTPGHTPEHLSFMVTDRGGGADQAMGIATGDFMFVGDLGRPDLLESAAKVEGASLNCRTTCRCGPPMAPALPAARPSARCPSRPSGTRNSSTRWSTPPARTRTPSWMPFWRTSRSRRSTSPA